MQGDRYEIASRIVTNTPAWVWVLLACLIWQGIQSFRPRTVSISRALLVPSVFVALGLSRIVLERETGALPIVSWLIGAALFSPLAIVTRARVTAVDRATGLITRPGSPVPLLRNLLIFTFKYWVAVAAAMQLAISPKLIIADNVFSGGTAGYFATWAALFLQSYRRVI